MKWVKPVLVEPKLIGWVNEGQEGDLFRLTVLSNHHLEQISKNQRRCFIEISLNNIKLVDGVNPITGYAPVLHESKVIIHI